MPAIIDGTALADMLPAGRLTLVSGASAESDVLADAVEAAGDRLGATSFSGVFVGGLNRRTWRAGSRSRILTFFATPVMRAGDERIDFLPLCYQDILSELRRRKPAAALVQCAPPDAQGNCSLGSEVSFIADLWREIPVRIAHINAAMPRTSGDPGIPYAELTAVIEADAPLKSMERIEGDGVSEQISNHVASLIEDGATLQTGLGKIPDAIMRTLTGRRGLRVHSGLIGEAMLDLVESGAMADGVSVTVGCGIGSADFYRRLVHPSIAFRPVSVTHGSHVLGAIKGLVAINSALEVDLFGQAYAELTPRGLASGPGGASDFARGARTGGGLRIIALPASAHGQSRIVAAGQGTGPVSLGRMDTDIVVTEHGVADLRGKGHEARADALIAIAAPEFRSSLAAAWEDYAGRF